MNGSSIVMNHKSRLGFSMFFFISFSCSHLSFNRLAIDKAARTRSNWQIKLAKVADIQPVGVVCIQVSEVIYGKLLKKIVFAIHQSQFGKGKRAKTSYTKPHQPMKVLMCSLFVFVSVANQFLFKTILPFRFRTQHKNTVTHTHTE